MQFPSILVREDSLPLDVCAVILGVPSGGLETDITVQFAVNNIGLFVTAADYSVDSLTAVFLSNQTTNNDITCISVVITDDNVLESETDEMITVEISDVSPDLQVLMMSTTIIILDNDSKLSNAW